MTRSLLLLFAVSLSVFAGDAVRPPAPPDGAAFTPQGDFAALKKAHQTKLRRPNKAPEDYNNFAKTPGTDVIVFKSGDLKLRAWLRMPPNLKVGKKVPAVVYFHTGFALTKSDLELSQPFVDAGFAVLVPTFRGENGNPGHFELFYGEVDDALAAVKWLATQPGVDADRIYTFGQSAGGAVSALLSLYADVPIRLTGSCGGIYNEKLFEALHKENLAMLPFDIKDDTEVRLRLLSRNTALMRRMHLGIIGRKDTMVMQQAREVQKIADAQQAPLKFSLVDGDPETCRAPAVEAFLKFIQQDLAEEKGKP